MEANQTQQKTNGALMGSIIVIIILVVGGFFLLKNNIDRPATESAPDYGDMEADLNNMDLENIDQEI